MINEAVIPSISQTIRIINQPQLVKQSEVVAAITPVRRVEKVQANVDINMDSLTVFSINTHA